MVKIEIAFADKRKLIGFIWDTVFFGFNKQAIDVLKHIFPKKRL